MTVISNKNISEAIYFGFREKTHGEQPDFLKNVVRFLFRKKMLSRSPEILTHLNKIINDEEGKMAVKIWSSKKLNENTRKEIVYSLSKHYGGKTIILEEGLDERLLGGYKIEVGDEVIDFTMKNKIAKLQEHLINKA